MTDHDLIEELLAVRALGGLDDTDAQTLDAALVDHGPACEECARLEREFSETAAGLALELEPAPLREGFEERVMAAARATMREGAVQVEFRPGTSPWVRRLGTLAAAAALLLGGWALRAVTEGSDAPPADFLAKATILRLEGDAEGSVSVAYRPGEPGAYVLGSDVPPAGEDRVYELWLIIGDTPESAGCFSPENGRIVGRFDQQVDQADVLAVTVEDSSCPTAPTTTPILAAEVTTA